MAASRVAVATHVYCVCVPFSESLHEAALRPAVEHGLDGVTVEDIADETGVSRRTFSNYSANKEDAILHADHERTVELVALVEGRPAGAARGDRRAVPRPARP